MSPEEFLALAREAGALLEGHFVLSSGLHSARYFQCARLLAHPDVATRVGAALGKKAAELGVDVTIAPALGGILVAHEVARALGVRALFAERDPASGELALRRGFSLEPNERVLVLEDVVTTGGSLRETMGVVRAHGGRVVATGALVDRGEKPARFDELPFLSLARLDVPVYEPSTCPLCQSGSAAVKPGSRSKKRSSA
jgi:orotate phosphoribosyltransferase